MLTRGQTRLLQAGLVMAIVANVTLIVWLPAEGVPPVGNVAAVVVCGAALWLTGSARS